MWATPVVQVIGMRPALAQETSPVCEHLYAVKIEILEETTSPCGGVRRSATGIEAEYCCEDIFEQQTTTGAGQCLVVPTSAEEGSCDKIASVAFTSGTSWSITFVEDCAYQDGLIALKDGDGCEAPSSVSYSAATRTLTIQNESTDKDISHVEFLFCCDH